MATTSVTTLKTSCGDDFRRFRAPEGPIGINGLRSRIQTLYDDRLSGRTWHVFYVDGEGDLITIAQDEDVELAFEAAAEAGSSTLRLYVEPDREPPRPAEPQAGAGDPCRAFLDQLLGGFAGQRRPGHPGPGWFGPCGPRGRCGPMPFCRRPRGGSRGEPTDDGEAPGASATSEREATAEPVTTHTPPTPPEPATASQPKQSQNTTPPPTSPTSTEATEPNGYIHVQAPRAPEEAKPPRPEDPQAAAAPAASRWERELSILKEMGLTVDEERLTASLDRHQGIIAGVLSEVFARMQ